MNLFRFTLYLNGFSGMYSGSAMLEAAEISNDVEASTGDLERGCAFWQRDHRAEGLHRAELTSVGRA